MTYNFPYPTVSLAGTSTLVYRTQRMAALTKALRHSECPVLAGWSLCLRRRPPTRTPDPVPSAINGASREDERLSLTAISIRKQTPFRPAKEERRHLEQDICHRSRLHHCSAENKSPAAVFRGRYPKFRLCLELRFQSNNVHLVYIAIRAHGRLRGPTFL